MDCKDFEKHVITYGEDGLKGELLSNMEEHRFSCQKCARLFQLHRLIFTSLNEAKPVKAPDGFAGRILSAAVSESPGTCKELNPDKTYALPGNEYSFLPVDCKTFEDNVAAYVDGFLKDSLHRAMEVHRISCPSCAHLANVHKTVVASLSTVEMVRAPEGLADHILAAVEGEISEVSEATAVVKPYTRYGLLTAALAAGGSLVAASVILIGAIAKYLSAIGSWPLSMDQAWAKLNTLSIYFDTAWSHLDRISFSLDAVWSQYTMASLNIKTWMAGELPVQWLEVANLLTAPVQLPFVSLSFPPYYLVALIALALTAWSYLSAPLASDMSAISTYDKRVL